MVISWPVRPGSAAGRRETLQPWPTVGVGRISLDPAGACRATPCARPPCGCWRPCWLSLVWSPSPSGPWAAVSAGRGRWTSSSLPSTASVARKCRCWASCPSPSPASWPCSPAETLKRRVGGAFSSPSSPARPGTWRYSFYHSTKTVPRDLRDLSDSMRLGGSAAGPGRSRPPMRPTPLLDTGNQDDSMSGAWGSSRQAASEAISARARPPSPCPAASPAWRLAIQQHDLRARVLERLLNSVPGHPDLRPAACSGRWYLGREVPADGGMGDLLAPWVLEVLRRATLRASSARYREFPGRWSPAFVSAAPSPCRRWPSPRPVRARAEVSAGASLAIIAIDVGNRAMPSSWCCSLVNDHPPYAGA